MNQSLRSPVRAAVISAENHGMGCISPLRLIRAVPQWLRLSGVSPFFAGRVLELLWLASLCVVLPAAAAGRALSGVAITAALPDSLAIEAQWGGTGSVMPPGIVMVARGASQAFDFVPAGCAVVTHVQVDNV